jgi:hypothetical protein
VPALPATSHASHWPAQARLQQTPSTQAPVAHSAFPTHALACGFLGTHWLPELQKLPALQSPSPPHVVLQAVAPQM